MQWITAALCGVVLCHAVLVAAQMSEEDSEDENDFSKVTYDSVIKLRHVGTGARLHSHEVTGFPSADDPNSFWIVRAAHGKTCKRGVPIPTNTLIRLEHLSTHKLLHTHRFPSPLSGQQEVAAFGNDGVGDSLDNWKVLVKNGRTWTRKEPIRLLHPETNTYLHSHPHRFQQPIAGQLEVTAFTRDRDPNNYWVAEEGLYYPSNE